MRQRRIHRSQAELTLREPDTVRYERGQLVAERATSSGNVIRVVYVEQLTDGGITALIVTVVRMAQ
jgi:hypothetical protein